VVVNVSIVAVKSRRIPSWKLEMAREIAELTKEYKTLLIVDLTGVPAKHIQMARKKLNNIAVMKVIKPKVALKVFGELGLPVRELEPHLTGQVMLVYSDKNPFELAGMIEGLVTYDYYSPGEVADKDIVIPEGNTGLPAGPTLSVFSRLKIPTKVQGNVIYVAKDTLAAKKGDRISPDLASILQKLGLALKEIRFKIKCAVDGGLVIPADKLKLNIAEYEEEIKRACLDAFKLAVELVVPEPIILSYVIQRAQREAMALAINAGIIAPETIEYLLRKAVLDAYAVAIEVAKYAPELGLGVQVKTQVQEERVEKKEEKPKEETEKESGGVSEEALAEGFAALFG
jgi:large subunit ribosomal protein L10